MEHEFYARYFDVEDKHWWFLGRRRVLLRLLDRYFGGALTGRPRILDVGCGTGTMVRELRRYGDVEGVDADERAVRLSHERGIDEVRCVAPGPLPFEDETFDLVTALDVVEHVEDDLGMLRELRRVLAPTGALLVTVPAFRFLWGAQDEISHHKRRYRARELRTKLLSAGFEVHRLSYFNFFLFPVIAGIRVLRPSRPRSSSVQSDFDIRIPRPANEVLARIFGAEASIVSRRNLPVGVSLVGLATKRAAPSRDQGVSGAQRAGRPRAEQRSLQAHPVPRLRRRSGRHALSALRDIEPVRWCAARGFVYR